MNMSWSSLMEFSSFMMSWWRASMSASDCLACCVSMMIWNTPTGEKRAIYPQALIATREGLYVVDVGTTLRRKVNQTRLSNSQFLHAHQYPMMLCIYLVGILTLRISYLLASKGMGGGGGGGRELGSDIISMGNQFPGNISYIISSPGQLRSKYIAIRPYCVLPPLYLSRRLHLYNDMAHENQGVA